MANEAVCIETPSRFARFTIAAAAVLPFGTLVYMSGDFTVSATSGADQPFAGIVWERVSTATSTHTEITVALDGVWDILGDSGSDNVGVAVSLSGANEVATTTDVTDIINGSFVGYLEEGAGNATTDRVRLTKFGSSGQL